MATINKLQAAIASYLYAERRRLEDEIKQRVADGTPIERLMLQTYALDPPHIVERPEDDHQQEPARANHHQGH